MKRVGKKRKREDEELYIDWQIAGAKAALCLRRFRSTYDPKWVELAERHLSSFNRIIQDMDRHWFSIADPVEHLGADRIGLMVQHGNLQDQS